MFLYPVLIIPVYQRGRNKKYKRTKKSLTLRACCWTRLRQLWWTSWWGWDCVCGADAPGLCTFPLKLRERWASDDDPTDVSEEGRTIGDARVEIEVTSEVVNVGVDWTVRDNVEIKNIYILQHSEMTVKICHCTWYLASPLRKHFISFAKKYFCHVFTERSSWFHTSQNHVTIPCH